MLWLFIACTSTKTIDTGLCVHTPTYDDWTKGFLDGKCQSCHSSATTNRHGAPAEITFDGENEAIYWSKDIHRSVLEEQRMPPSGGITDVEYQLLEEWISCVEQYK